jgi:hypothetical protein
LTITATVTGNEGLDALSPPPERSAWLLVAAVTVLAVILRAIGLNGGLWYDEIVTLVESVRPPLTRILTEYPWNNKHPLYAVLGHLAVQAFGEHPWSLRLPAYAFGVASVPLLYLLGKLFTSRRECLAAAALLAVSYHPVWFSQNARGYSALAFWTLLATYLLIRCLRERRWRWPAGYAVASALGMYTHLTMAFVVAAHAVMIAGLWITTHRRDSGQGRWRFPAAAMALTAAFTLMLYAPMVLRVNQFFAQAPDPVGAAVANPGWACGEALRGLRIGLGTWAALAAAGLALGGLGSYFKQSRFVGGLFLLPAALTALAAVATHRPVFPRFFFFLIGIGLLVLARGATVTSAWVAGASTSGPRKCRAAAVLGNALLALLLLGSAVSLAPAYRFPKQDFERALRFVEAHQGSDDRVLTVGLTVTLPCRRYFGKTWGGIDTLRQLRDLSPYGRRTWLLYTFPAYLAPDLLATIRREFAPVRVFRGTVGGGDIFVCRGRAE